MSDSKKSNGKNILITVLLIMLIASFGYIIYSHNNNVDKENKNTNTQNSSTSNNDKNNEKDSNYSIISEAFNGINVIKNTNNDIDVTNGDPIEMVEKVSLPKILKDTEVTRKINQKILDDNNYAVSCVKNGLNNQNNPNELWNITVNYDYTVNNDILYILVTTNTTYFRSHSINNYYSYYYDIKNDKELNTDDIMNILNIKISDIKDAKEITNIMYLNNFKQAHIYYKDINDECFLGDCLLDTTISLN